MEKINLKNKKWFILTYYTEIDDSSLVGGLRPYKLLDYLKEKVINAKIVTRQKCRGDEIVIYARDIPNVFKKLLRIVPPDRFIFWAMRVAYYLRKYNDFVFFSTSPPNGIHTTGLIFKLLNRNFFWIIDYRDPFLLNDFYKPIFLKHFFNKWYERQIFKKADVILLNTDSNMESHKKAYPFAEKKMLAVRNGFDTVMENTASDENSFIYAGGTSKGLATKKIVEILTVVNGPKFQATCDFYGEYDIEIDNCAYTIYKGVINPDDVPMLLKNYKFGFIFLPLPFLGGGRIAQKYYDYIGSGVIPVVINPSKELENLVIRYNTGVCIFPDSKVEDIFQNLKNASFNMSEEDRESFMRDNQFQKFLSHLSLP